MKIYTRFFIGPMVIIEMYSAVSGHDCQKFNNLLKRLWKFSFRNKNKLLDGKCLIKVVATDRNRSRNERKKYLYKKTNGNSKTFGCASNSKVMFVILNRTLQEYLDNLSGIFFFSILIFVILSWWLTQRKKIFYPDITPGQPDLFFIIPDIAINLTTITYYVYRRT
jgi:hypothetical protein